MNMFLNRSIQFNSIHFRDLKHIQFNSLPRRLSSSEPRRQTVGLLGVCDDYQSSFMRGPASAPPVIRDALHSDSANSFCEVLPLEPVLTTYRDFGNVSTDEANPSNDEPIRTAVTGVLDSGLRPLILGGDHAISYPVIAALRAWRLQNQQPRPSFGIVHFDAHPDLYDNFEGNRRSHACPFARICELNEDGSGRHISQLVQLGIRTHTAHSREQAEKFGVACVEMSAWPETRAALTEDLSNALRLPGASEEPAGGAGGAGAGAGAAGAAGAVAVVTEPPMDVYCSFDLDVLDPSCAPGVSHHEPGGLTTRQALDAVHALAALQARGAVNLIGADVVELNPRRDPSGITAMTAAKIVKELMGLLHDADARFSR